MPSSTVIDPMPGVSGVQSTNYRIGTLNLGTYATNGVAVTPAQFRLATLHDLDVRPAGGYVAAWDKANGVVLAYQQSAATGALTEVPNATNLAAVNFRILAFGV